MPQTLFALADNPKPDALLVGVMLHLQYAPLTIFLMQVDSAQQLYLQTPGCAGCGTGRCLPGCRADLLGRAVRAAGGTLRSVRSGLHQRPYARTVVAWPQRGAQPLDATITTPFAVAQLRLDWRTDHRVCARLAVGGDGPDPRTRLRAAGWSALTVPSRLVPLVTKVSFAAGRWPTVPFLPLPHTTALPIADPPRVPLTPDGTDALLAEWLQHLVVDPERALRAVPTSSPAPLVPEADGWPHGPGTLTSTQLAQLVPQLLAEPTLRSTRPGQSGLTKGRLVGLRHAALTDATARALMVWFDAAGVLAPPEGNQGPWRAPRPFALDDVAAIATRLSATPLPTAAAIRAAYGGD